MAVTNMIRFTDVIEPTEQNVEVYKKLFKAFVEELIKIDTNKRVTRNL